MAAVTICSDFGAQKNKIWHCFHCFPIYFPWSDGTGCHDLRFLPYDPSIPVQGIHTEETTIETDTCTPMFIAALFIVARTWRQPRCPPADEWIRKLWHIYTMEYYSAIKKNAFELILMRWMKLELTEWSKSERKTPIQYINAYIWNLERW